MKCISSATGRQLLDEIHAGQCGIHAASRTLAGKVFRSGFYWLTTKSDAAELVQRCEACQFCQSNSIYQHSSCRPYLQHGHLRAGDWTQLDPSRKLREAILTCWSPSINSPNG
jgi:hypothetical protein